MAVSKMQRVNIFGLHENRKATLERLQFWGVLELNFPEEQEGLHKMDTVSSKQRFERRVQSLKQALEVLSQYAPVKSGMLDSLAGKDLVMGKDYEQVISRKKEIRAVATEILIKEKEIAELNGAIARLENQIVSLTPWKQLDVPMNCSGTGQTALMLGTLPGVWDQTRILTELAELTEIAPDVTIITQADTCAYVAVLVMKDEAKELEEALRSIGFARPSQTSARRPAESIAALEQEIAQKKQEIQSLSEAIAQRSGSRKDFEVLADYYQIRADKYELLGKLPMSKQTFVISGYVPANRAQVLAEDLAKRCNAAVEIEELPEEEEAPVLLKNNKFGAMSEGTVKSFGLPGKGEIDPSFLTSIFFVFFFGLMLSDAAYGFLLSLVCGILLIKYPRMGSGLRKNIQLFFWGGLSTVFWGVMFSGYFGDAVNVISRVFIGKEVGIPALWFAPLNDPTRLLMYSMLFGLIHLFAGLGVKSYMDLKKKDIMSFIFNDLCWFLMLLGLIFMLLPTDLFYGISQMRFSFPPIVGTIAKFSAIGGAVGILLFSARDNKNPVLRIALGAYDLYNISGWLSDVLSYSRLLALGLATGVIAQVVNQMGSMFGNSVIGIILFVIVFIAGHTLNIGINLLGAYVHTCRLQYVEFYGKFYEGGGREFEPFKQNTTYVDIKEDI